MIIFLYLIEILGKFNNFFLLKSLILKEKIKKIIKEMKK